MFRWIKRPSLDPKRLQTAAHKVASELAELIVDRATSGQFSNPDAPRYYSFLYRQYKSKRLKRPVPPRPVDMYLTGDMLERMQGKHEIKRGQIRVWLHFPASTGWDPRRSPAQKRRFQEELGYYRKGFGKIRRVFTKLSPADRNHFLERFWQLYMKGR